MKFFLKQFLYFITPILVILFILELSLNNCNTTMKQKATFLNNNAKLINILILGNSHAGDGVDPSQFDYFTFNIANPNQSLFYDIEIVKKYFNRMVNLKYVIISVDYHSLYYQYCKEREFMYSTYFKIDYLPAGIKKHILLYNYGLKTSINLLLSSPTNVGKGWRYVEGTNYKSLTSLKGKIRVNWFNEIIDNNILEREKILTNLEEFILFLKNRNVEPIILTLPCHKFCTNKLSNIIINSNKKDIKYLCDRYKIKSIYFLNKEFSDSLFFDVDHLNKNGASFISKMINDSIIKYERTKYNHPY